jgi:hypothetical protein
MYSTLNGSEMPQGSISNNTPGVLSLLPQEMPTLLKKSLWKSDILSNHMSFLISPIKKSVSRLVAISSKKGLKSWQTKIWKFVDTFRNRWSCHLQAENSCSSKRLTNRGRKTVSMLIEGKYLDAVEDTGSDRSCMDLDTAQQLCLNITYAADVQQKFLLPNGRVLISVGQTQANCSFIKGQKDILFLGKFYIFSRLHIPVILGNDLLDSAAKTFSLPKAERKPMWHPLQNSLTMELNHPDGQPKKFRAVLDTGVDVNVISLEIAMSLNLKVLESDGREFCTANGGIVKPLGLTQLRFTLANTSPKLRYKARFYVFEKSVVPILLGNKLIRRLDLFGDNMHLLSYQKYNGGEGAKGEKAGEQEEGTDGPRVTHLHQKDDPPTRRIMCLINGKMVYANADTGADLNLVSPSLATRLCSNNQSMRKENLDITFADGSKAHIKASFEAPFSPHSSPQETLSARFYILDGLTSDAFIGWNLLFKIEAFTRNRDSFTDLTEKQMFHNLNLITDLEERSFRLLGMFRTGRRTNRSNATPTATTLQTLPEPSSPDSEFYGALARIDARETNRRETVKQEIARLNGAQKAIAVDAENMKIDRYEAEKTRRLAERSQQANTTP